MWHEKLQEMKDYYHENFGDTFNEGASVKEIQKLQEEARKRLNQELPEEYMEVLKEINGFNENGIFFYGVDEELLDSAPVNHVDGFLDYNEDRSEYDEEKNIIYLCEGAIDWYVYDINEKAYKLLDAPCGDEVETFESFDEMMCVILDETIGMDDEEDEDEDM